MATVRKFVTVPHKLNVDTSNKMVTTIKVTATQAQIYV